MDELLVVPTVAEGAWYFVMGVPCGVGKDNFQGLAALPLFFLFSSWAEGEWMGMDHTKRQQPQQPKGRQLTCVFFCPLLA